MGNLYILLQVSALSLWVNSANWHIFFSVAVLSIIFFLSKLAMVMADTAWQSLKIKRLKS